MPTTEQPLVSILGTEFPDSAGSAVVMFQLLSLRILHVIVWVPKRCSVPSLGAANARLCEGRAWNPATLR